MKICSNGLPLSSGAKLSTQCSPCSASLENGISAAVSVGNVLHGGGNGGGSSGRQKSAGRKPTGGNCNSLGSFSCPLIAFRSSTVIVKKWTSTCRTSKTPRGA